MPNWQIKRTSNSIVQKYSIKAWLNNEINSNSFSESLIKSLLNKYHCYSVERIA